MFPKSFCAPRALGIWEYILSVPRLTNLFVLQVNDQNPQKVTKKFTGRWKAAQGGIWFLAQELSSELGSGPEWLSAACHHLQGQEQVSMGFCSVCRSAQKTGSRAGQLSVGAVSHAWLLNTCRVARPEMSCALTTHTASQGLHVIKNKENTSMSSLLLIRFWNENQFHWFLSYFF